MNKSIAADDVDGAIGDLVGMAVEHVIQERCTPLEAARIRLAIGNPSAEIQEYLDDASGLVVEALAIGVPELLNRILFPDSD